MNGPYGVVVRFRRPSNIQDEGVEKATAEAHKMFETLPGFRSVVYYNINEEEYAAALAFYTRKSAESALDPIRKHVQATIPEAFVSFAAVTPGDFADEFIATGGNVERER